MDEFIKYRTDKVIDYFKYVSTASIAIIALLVTLKEKLKYEFTNDLAPTILGFFLMLSLAISYYGYYSVIDKMFKEENNHSKIIRNCQRISGAIFVAVVGSIALNVKIT